MASVAFSRTTKQKGSVTTLNSQGKNHLVLSFSILLASTSLGWTQGAIEIENLEPIVVTASGSETNVVDAPASVTVLTSEQIERLPAQDIRDVLKRVEGVTIDHSGNQEKIQIRGLGERYTLYLIDGKRVTSAPNLFRGNDMDSGWVPIEAIDRIEIVRGPMSSLYGSDAIGGVVNIITKKQSNEWTGSVTTEFTAQENRKSGDYGRVGFSLSGPIIKDKLFLNSYGSYDYRHADAKDINPNPIIPGFYESDDRYIDNTLTWLIDDANELDVNYGYSRRLQNITTLSRHSGGLTHRGEYDFAQTELKVYGDRVHNDYGHGNPGQLKMPNTAYNFNADAKVNTEFDFLVPHKLTVGGSYKYQRVDDKFVLTGQGGDTSSVWQGAGFIEDRILLTDRFEMTFGNRLDYHEHFGLNASPRAYGVFKLNDAFTIKGGWSSSFKAPTLLENSENWQQISCGGSCYMIGSKDLKPEVGNSVELGVNFQNDIINAGVTAFHNTITDMIPFPPARTGNLAQAVTYANYVGLAPDGKPQFTYENIDQARTMGVEASIAIQAMENLTLTANYTYLDAKATSGTERPLAYQPEHSANFGADWQATDRWSFGLKVNYVGEQYTYVPSTGNMAFAHRVDSYVTADVTTQYDVNDNFTMRAGVLNLTDTTVNRKTWDDFNIDGRRYFLSATARF